MPLGGWFGLIPLAGRAGGDDELGISGGPGVVETASELVISVNDAAVAGFFMAVGQERFLQTVWNTRPAPLDLWVERIVPLEDSVIA